MVRVRARGDNKVVRCIKLRVLLVRGNLDRMTVDKVGLSTDDRYFITIIEAFFFPYLMFNYILNGSKQARAFKRF